ncbi:hypothetical protein AMAG_06806 [Allomyces macrogynus ATCC 38327]|uniref:Cytochrome b5 heme-binding domain-containing protein n=1 Tax=Allomyces macrogynus (strain ATCC 38327) TaxID=578462 RepID=A0A0L0SEX4_ALLM3|nr:hypothetical protein AMAG_06806 [Allomyces macrogynus ATCC 38327]|eukprot:KNE61051.1 hypothetical protein AMAG_06806 [Allomyces macrogynus ATCC 38327]
MSSTHRSSIAMPAAATALLDSASLALTSPVNAALAAALALYLWRVWWPSSSWATDLAASADHAPNLDATEPILIRSFTPRELAHYDGKQTDKIYVAVLGRVFDVTAGKAFYGPGGPYGNFAGRDASRGLSKHSFDVSMLTPIDQPIDDLADLTPDERAAVADWAGHFATKYTHVGFLVEPDAEQK